MSYQGGAITNAGQIEEITDSDFTGNSTSGSGGAIANVAPQSSTAQNPSVSLTNVNFTGNSAGEYGGAIANMNGTVSLDQTTMTGNTAGIGGGIYNAAGATVELSGTNTITSNTSSAGFADDIYTEGTVAVSNGETTVGAITVTETGVLNVSGTDATAALEVTDSIQSAGNVTVGGNGSMSLEATAGDSHIATLSVVENGEFLTENTASSTTIGTLSTAGDVTLGSANTTIESLNVTANSGSVTFANGNATVADLLTTGTDQVRVGGAGLSASLTLTGDLGLAVADGSVVVDNLGALNIRNDQIQDADVGWADLKAGGTITVTDLGDKLTAEELDELTSNLFAENGFAGLLDIGNTTVEVAESGGGHVDYSADLKGIKNNQLINKIVDVDATEAGDLHGAFARVHVTDNAATSITTQNTLQLAGTTSGGALAYAIVDGEEVALDANIGAVNGGTTAEASLILGDYSLPNSGTLGDIAMNATKSILDVRGNDSPEGLFKVGTITAKEGISNALVNVTGTSLQSGAIDLSGATDGGVVVDHGSLTVQDEEASSAGITFNETNGGTLAVINGSSLHAGDVAHVNTLTVENSEAHTGNVTAVADAKGNAADILVNNGTFQVDGSVTGESNIVVNGRALP